MHINPEIRAIADAIKDAVPAEQIYLFGSYAYGQPDEDSDYDFFVIVPDGVRPMEVMQKAQCAIPMHIDKSVDVLANTRSGFGKRKGWVSTIEKVVNQKGVLLYDGRSRPMA